MERRHTGHSGCSHRRSCPERGAEQIHPHSDRRRQRNADRHRLTQQRHRQDRDMDRFAQRIRNGFRRCSDRPQRGQLYHHSHGGRKIGHLRGDRGSSRFGRHRPARAPLQTGFGQSLCGREQGVSRHRHQAVFVYRPAAVVDDPARGAGRCPDRRGQHLHPVELFFRGQHPARSALRGLGQWQSGLQPLLHQRPVHQPELSQREQSPDRAGPQRRQGDHQNEHQHGQLHRCRHLQLQRYGGQISDLGRASGG